jgi:hypothetical protein
MKSVSAMMAIAGMFGTSGNPSFSSQVYRELSRKAMTALITHLERVQ